MAPLASLPLRSFSDLSPTEFENFAFDVLNLSNVRNLTWRTPGADGGRDIEGEIFTVDFSGFSTRQRWYFECKRYASSLDWALVYAKVAHADANGADFLLVITNSSPSPSCETSISTWNSAGRSPQIRFWRGYELGFIADQFPAVAAKYGLRRSAEPLAGQFLDLALEISKISQGAYAATIVGTDPISAIEASAALSELFLVRAKNLAEHGQFVALPADTKPQLYPWVVAIPEMIISETALRASLAAFRFAVRAKNLRVVEQNGVYLAISEPAPQTKLLSESAQRLLGLVGLWSDFDLVILDDGTLRIATR